MTGTQHTRPQAPQAPTPAERARTIASHGGPASLLPALDDTVERVTPALQHVHASGSVSLLLPDDHPIVTSSRGDDEPGQNGQGELPMMLELADEVPVDVREPVRGLLWITGWLRGLDERAGRARAMSIADNRPDPRLLDVGHGLSVLRLTPVALVLSDAEGTHPLTPQAFRTATPDPFCHDERRWLRHLESAHADVLTQLARHVPEPLRHGRIHPLGLDRYGLRLRVECGDDDHDVRLSFSRPVDDPAQLATELRKLVGCPFHNRV